MEYKWLNKQNNSKLIVFFNGWGMDENIVNHLEFGLYDVVMFYDYNNLKTDFNFKILNSYQSTALIAWSMGVMIATMFGDYYTTKTAINGTLKPIDDVFGIPQRVYDLTLRGFSQAGAKKFVEKMFDTGANLVYSIRTFENQKSELFALQTYCANLDFQYSKIIISDNDKIIPTKNQSAFWNLAPNMNGSHAIFHRFKSWEDLI